MLKGHIPKPRLLDKSRAAYRRACKQDPFLPPLLSTAGKVEVKDAVRVVLPTPDGKAIIRASSLGWRFAIEYVDHLPAALADARTAVVPPIPAAATVDQAKSNYDAVLDLIVDLERRIFANFERRMLAFEAKHHLPSNNVVNFSNIAAE